jgi:hypothetical protein
MTTKTETAKNVDDAMDVVLHDEIKWRAYQLYEGQGDNAEDRDLRNELKSELLRVAYAAAQLQKYCNGEVGDTKAVRAARVYLRALSSFIGQA